MNPLKSVNGTIILGFVTAVAIMLAFGGNGLNVWSLVVWLHVFFGIIWIGLLYYFNFVQVPAVGAALADEGRPGPAAINKKDGTYRVYHTDEVGPGPAAINKYVAPRALWWFRWGALLTWLSGASALEVMGIGLKDAFTLSGDGQIIGIGAWLGTIMLFNVWVLIWPNQKKILGMVEASADEIAKSKMVALMASRTNTFLSIPMIMCMVGQGHGGLPF
jgi:uncharacterized membrane protein